ncbi:MAG: AAA family ATPase [Lachnospiraceae bacterium]|nr:AAA family ATPase [Lachnospiraceae bacterium]
MERSCDLTEALAYIDPAELSYQEWVNVGMALKEAGYSVAVWEDWSRADKRYHAGECVKKWASFRGCSTPVTAGTIVQMARENGWRPHRMVDDHELSWDDCIGGNDDLVVVNPGWIEGQEIQEPENWKPEEQLITYLELLFDSSDYVGYVTETWEHDGKYLPKKGNYDRTAGELIAALRNCKGDIGSVIGDYKPEAGAWIRFNPVDGKGVKNDNVTEFRYALVESDAEDIEKQNAILRELELPIVTLTHSGGKSLHAIVRIDAGDYAEYRKRVEYLYEVCKKNGLKVDTQNKNPSRLSRLPGVMRNGRKQFLVATNIGKESWKEWQEWIESINDDLPDYESLAVEWGNLPELAPPLIEGVLRQGHKMLLAGPSKAGKSFALIELCIAIAEGRRWLGWQCAKGKVLYVNLELDRASCLHRFRDVYEAMQIAPNNLANIDLWNLRGHSVPMDRLAPKLIRRATKKGYLAVIIDPIYKVITGDENSADQMANFCNQFDKVCTELSCAVIYCHHHSKGAQGGKKSMDRASGSGVFARDPDALLDLTELEVNEKLLLAEQNRARCDVYAAYMGDMPSFDPSQDELCSSAQLGKIAERICSASQLKEIKRLICASDAAVAGRTAWRIEGTLREFPKFPPVNLWFDYPVHRADAIGALADVQPEEEKPMWQKGKEARKKQGETERKSRQTKYNMAIENFRFEYERYPTVQELYEQMKSDAEAVGESCPAIKTIWNSLKKMGYTTHRNTKQLVPLPEKSGVGNIP